MKIACDICEKVENEDKTRKWISISVNDNTRYLFCEKCERKFWNIFNNEKSEE